MTTSSSTARRRRLRLDAAGGAPAGDLGPAPEHGWLAVFEAHAAFVELGAEAETRRARRQTGSAPGPLTARELEVLRAAAVALAHRLELLQKDCGRAQRALR